jgi:anaerobic magnesium-protoporphyrin IX monomethyl ester cyclase
MTTARSVVLFKAPYLEIYGSFNTDSHYVALGPLYLHSYLRKRNIPVLFKDPEAEGMSDDDIVAFVEEKNPIIVGITCNTSNYPQARRLATTVKNHFDDLLIILGGAHATAIPEIILQTDSDVFDYVCLGEGEETLHELYEALLGNNDPKNIAGLAFKSAGEIVITNPRGFIKDIDDIPFPSRDQIDVKRYTAQANLHQGKVTATLITSRGCPFKCDYCQSKYILGQRIRFHSADYVVAEIEELQRRYNIKYLAFADDVFTANRSRLAQIMEGIRSRDLDIRFWCMARADMLDDETIRLLKLGGMSSISIGVESGDEEILKDIGKRIKKEDVKRAFGLLKQHKVDAQAFFMIGFYNDTRESIAKTVNFALELDPDFATFGVMVPYPGTEVYEKHYKDLIDFSQPDVWKYFQALGGGMAGFGGRYLTREDFNRLRAKAFRKFYLRPKKLVQLARKIEGMDQLKQYAKTGWVVTRGLATRSAGGGQ